MSTDDVNKKNNGDDFINPIDNDNRRKIINFLLEKKKVSIKDIEEMLGIYRPSCCRSH